MTIYIDQETLKRVNIHAPYKGRSKLDTPEIRAAVGVIEIPDPVAPEDYSPDTHYMTEQDDAPYVIYTMKSPEQIQALMLAKYEQALDEHLDKAAQEDRWSNRFTFVARAGYPNMWQQKAIAFGTWMDTCNAHAYQMLQDVIAGTIQMPTIEDFIAGLPEFTYP
jgi:hypothetical protein